MIGQIISHYKITAKLGAGGMGEVYLATDTTLDRPVALKFLPPDLSQDEEARERLIREAMAASKLNHPGVLTVHAVEHADDLDFIVMEYIEGRLLRTALKQDDLAVPKILDIASQICEGLTAAHSAGVIHRDVKPENIILTPEGRVKIMDFGLATWRGASNLTRDGSTVGTTTYMSPEQVQDFSVDHRADLWSLGVVLYEMLTCHVPFAGEHEAAVIYSIVNESPEPLARYKADLPESLQTIVAKLLEKDADLRYQSAADVHADLRRLAQMSVTTRPTTGASWKRIAGTVLAVIAVAAIGYLVSTIRSPENPAQRTCDTEVRRLVVLPFRNLGEADQDYFTDGLTDEISLKISRVRGLAVISRGSAIQYKGLTRSAREIGKDLAVQYLVEGTVRWQETGGVNRVRVITRLVATADNMELWSDSYDADIADMFGVQGEIAQSVAEALDVTLFERDRSQLAKGGTRNVESYDFFLRANEYFNRGNVREDLRHAIELYERAVQSDTTFAEAYAKLSWAHMKAYWKEVDPTPARLRMARDAVDHALDLDPDLPEARLALGYYHYWGSLDYGRALSEFMAALENDPSNSELLGAVGYVQRRLGEFDQTLAYLGQSLALDPRSNEKALEIGNTHLRMRQWVEAERYIRRALSLAPDYEWAYELLADVQIYGYSDVPEARQIIADASKHLGKGHLVEKRVWLDLLQGDYEGALHRTVVATGGTIFDTTFYYDSKARIYSAMNDDHHARAYYDSARVKLEAFVSDDPDYAAYRRYLAIAFAGVQRGDDAIREAREAMRLARLQRDAFVNGPRGVEALAQVYTMLGMYELAFDQIELLLSLPAGLISVPYLRIAPEYADLRSLPRFQQLVDSSATVQL